MRLYVTPQELTEMPLGQVLSNQIAQLPAGSIDTLLARASQRCDSFCEKRLQAPGSTILTAAVPSGTTVLSVASTLTFDNLEEQGVILGSGPTQEILDVVPGGISITRIGGAITSPYPGTITLAEPTAFSHASGEPLQGVWREVSQVGSVSSSDPFAEAYALSQDAQLSMAHMPPIRYPLARVFFVKSYPIQQIIAISHAYSYNNAYHDVAISSMSIVPSEGWFRANIGSVILEEGLLKTTYIGGHTSVPDDIKDATIFYLRDSLLQFENPYGLVAKTMGKRSTTFRQGIPSPNVSEAERILLRYKRST